MQVLAFQSEGNALTHQSIDHPTHVRMSRDPTTVAFHNSQQTILHESSQFALGISPISVELDIWCPVGLYALLVSCRRMYKAGTRTRITSAACSSNCMNTRRFLAEVTTGQDVLEGNLVLFF